MAVRPNEVNLCQVLCQPPSVIFGVGAPEEGFFEMIKNLLAPKYRLYSVTTILIFLPIVLYVILGIVNASFLKLPFFAVDGIILDPFKLQQFQFHRLWTAPFVSMDLNEALFNSLMAWMIGSLAEDIYGWKIAVVFIGLPGLVGSACSTTFLLVGLIFAFLIVEWADSRLEMMVRRMQIIIYLVVGLLCFLFLLSQERSRRIAIYSSLLYGFLLGFVIGQSRPIHIDKSFVKLGRFLSTFILLLISTLLIMGIVFYGKTVV